MKKIRNLVLILALFMCLNGCEKNPINEESLQHNEELTVSQARSFFEMQTIDEFTLKSGNIQLRTITIKPDWTTGKPSNNSDVSVIETEILAMGRFGFATPESMDAWNVTKDEIYLHSMSRLVVIKMRKTGEMHSFIMSVVGEKLYFEGKKFKLKDNYYLKREKDLTGLVIFHDLSGRFINGWIYCDGQITNSIVHSENIDLSVELKSAMLLQAIYGWVRVCPGGQYSYVDSDGTPTVVMQSCYEVLTILGYYETDGGGGSSSGGTTGGTSGGTSGGYDPAPPTPTPAPEPCVCLNECPICKKCRDNLVLKSANTNCVPRESCTCPPSNPIPPISSLTSPFGVVANMTAREVYFFIGGNVLINYQSNESAFKNACALRLSYTLNSIHGSEIPFIEGKTLSGDVNRDGTKEWYFYRVSDMVDYLNSTFGSCTLTDTNHIVGMTGIIWQSDCGWDDASGHIDIWNRNNALGHYYDRCSIVYIWRN